MLRATGSEWTPGNFRDAPIGRLLARSMPRRPLSHGSGAIVRKRIDGCGRPHTTGALARLQVVKRHDAKYPVENTSNGNRQLWQQTLVDTRLACATLPNFVAGAPLAAH